MRDLQTTRSAEQWVAWTAERGLKDVFWSWDHAQIWSQAWNSVVVGVRYSVPEEQGLLLVLLSDLSALPGGEGRVDLRTAYDFGGMLCSGPSSLPGFEQAWDRQLKEWGVVTEFQRLHPLRPVLRPSYAEQHAENYVVDLTLGYDAIQTGYNATFRRELRQALPNGPDGARVDSDPDATACVRFAQLYEATMDRVGAPPWYRFSERLLTELIGLPEASLVTALTKDGEVAGMALLLRSGDELFYHLSASDVEHRSTRPNHRIFDAMVRFGVQSGCRRLHLGGGSVNLRRWKSKIATGSVPYAIVKRVVDPEAYGKICAAAGVSQDSGPFPAYLESWYASLGAPHA